MKILNFLPVHYERQLNFTNIVHDGWLRLGESTGGLDDPFDVVRVLGGVSPVYHEWQMHVMAMNWYPGRYVTPTARRLHEIMEFIK